ncbi:hypothetical protein E4T56_gene13250 [Termitomyces sp. T112]|nr:hypothetical protein E4T56_gene13250 [Termitomyces sp. T112]
MDYINWNIYVLLAVNHYFMEFKPAFTLGATNGVSSHSTQKSHYFCAGTRSLVDIQDFFYMARYSSYYGLLRATVYLGQLGAAMLYL